jgi:hypothetical protein
LPKTATIAPKTIMKAPKTYEYLDKNLTKGLVSKTSQPYLSDTLTVYAQSCFFTYETF